MRQLDIDLELLAIALESHNAESSWVLDLETGEVIPLVDPSISGETADTDEVERIPDRYLPVEPIPSHESFGIMERFAEELPHGPARSRLLDALERRHPFREFKDTLFAFPDLRERWFEYHEQRLRTLAEEWLESVGVKNSPRTPPSGQKNLA